MMNMYTFENDFGTGEYILTVAYARAREGNLFQFGNIGKRKVNNMIKKYNYYMDLQETNDKRGFDTSKQREALRIVKNELDKIA